MATLQDTLGYFYYRDRPDMLYRVKSIAEKSAWTMMEPVTGPSCQEVFLLTVAEALQECLLTSKQKGQIELAERCLADWLPPRFRKQPHPATSDT
jgi:hypothetical protein